MSIYGNLILNEEVKIDSLSFACDSEYNNFSKLIESIGILDENGLLLEAENATKENIFVRLFKGIKKVFETIKKAIGALIKKIKDIFTNKRARDAEEAVKKLEAALHSETAKAIDAEFRYSNEKDTREKVEKERDRAEKERDTLNSKIVNHLNRLKNNKALYFNFSYVVDKSKVEAVPSLANKIAGIAEKNAKADLSSFTNAYTPAKHTQSQQSAGMIFYELEMAKDFSCLTKNFTTASGELSKEGIGKKIDENIESNFNSYNSKDLKTIVNTFVATMPKEISEVSKYIDSYAKIVDKLDEYLTLDYIKKLSSTYGKDESNSLKVSDVPVHNGPGGYKQVTEVIRFFGDCAHCAKYNQEVLTVCLTKLNNQYNAVKAATVGLEEFA